jgi:hypothetical protein
MSETNSVVAIYETHVQAEEAAKELQRSGFDMKKMSIVGKDYHTDEHVVAYYNPCDRMKYWGGAGLYSIGIPQDSVVKYESALKFGKFLVLAYGSGDEVGSARDIIQTAHPMEMAVHAAEWEQRAGVGAS